MPGRDEPLADEEPLGGEAACWAHLVCPECGAIENEGHRPGCLAAPLAAERKPLD